MLTYIKVAAVMKFSKEVDEMSDEEFYNSLENSGHDEQYWQEKAERDKAERDDAIKKLRQPPPAKKTPAPKQPKKALETPPAKAPEKTETKPEPKQEAPAKEEVKQEPKTETKKEPEKKQEKKTDLNSRPKGFFEKNQDTLASIGTGAVTGLTTYGALGFLPPLSRQRLLRALIGLTVGTGAGFGTYALLNQDTKKG